MHFDGHLWTEEQVVVYLEEAADTLRRLPRGVLQNKVTSWPDVVQSSAELFMGEKYARNRLSPPSPKAIDRMDVVLGWLLPLKAQERRILWARACHIPWRKLEDIDGRSHVTLRKVYKEGLQGILKQLNERGLEENIKRAFG